jgi:presenilin-like A22 family membrane protease
MDIKSMKSKVFAQLIVLFLITQILGLAVGFQLIPQEEVRAHLVSEDPEDVANPIALIAYILVMTGVLLLIIHFITGRLLYWLLKGLETLAVLGTSIIVFGSFFNALITIILSLGLVVSRIIWKKHVLLRNISSTIAVAGVGALIGVSFGILPVVVFIILLSVYDLIAVFKTKHMVTLAKGVTQKNLAFTFALPTKEHTFELGTGDMVIPLTFAVSVLNATKVSLPLEMRLIPAAVILIASLAGLIWTINFSAKKIGRALPALPPQTVLMVLAYALVYATGYFF